MDALDVKILRALVSESSVAPSSHQVTSSLRSIAARLGADDVTVRNRYKKLRGSGAMSGWRLVINPAFFGCRLLEATVDVQPESAKPDMIRKLKLVNSVVTLSDFLGRALTVLFMYNSEESRSRTVELISRITNAESVVKTRMALPQCETKRLTGTDIAIIRALSKDARKPSVLVAKELGLSTRTVRARIDNLRKERTIFTIPDLNLGKVQGLIPAWLSYSYVSEAVKTSVDRAMVTRFESNYLWTNFSDPENGFIVLSAPTIADVKGFLDWAKSQPGVAGVRVDIPTEMISFPGKLSELLQLRDDERGRLERRLAPV